MKRIFSFPLGSLILPSSVCKFFKLNVLQTIWCLARECGLFSFSSLFAK